MDRIKTQASNLRLYLSSKNIGTQADYVAKLNQLHDIGMERINRDAAIDEHVKTEIIGFLNQLKSELDTFR